MQSPDKIAKVKLLHGEDADCLNCAHSSGDFGCMERWNEDGGLLGLCEFYKKATESQMNQPWYQISARKYFGGTILKKDISWKIGKEDNERRKNQNT